MSKGLAIAIPFVLGFLVAKGLKKVLPFALGVAVGVTLPRTAKL